ncbi:MAG: hypothetical protein AAGA65_09145 [Actinomycetota bacterium]
MTVTLIDGDLNRHTLACPGGPYFLGVDSGLWGVSPALLQFERVAGSDGATLRQVSSGPKTLVVPVRVGTDVVSTGEQQNRFAQLMDGLRPDVECRLEVERPGVHREIVARYSRGAASDEVFRRHSQHRGVVVRLEFVALDPVWRNVADPVSTYPADPTVVELFDNAYFGHVNEVTINCDSTLPVSPRFTIAGEVQNVEVMHRTTGAYWRMTERLTRQTDVMVVETDPRNGVGAYLNGGLQSWFFDPFSTLERFVLIPGENRLDLRGLSDVVVSPGASASFRIEWVDQYRQC